jgi:hypothetical protein
VNSTAEGGVAHDGAEDEKSRTNCVAATSPIGVVNEAAPLAVVDTEVVKRW